MIILFVFLPNFIKFFRFKRWVFCWKLLKKPKKLPFKMLTETNLLSKMLFTLKLLFGFFLLEKNLYRYENKDVIKPMPTIYFSLRSEF